MIAQRGRRITWSYVKVTTVVAKEIGLVDIVIVTVVMVIGIIFPKIYYDFK